MNTRQTLIALLLAPLLLGGCARIESLFTDSKLPPLTGERVSILQLQRDLAPDPALQQSPPALPEAWTNKSWPQAGGYPSHAMGHLALAAELKKAWSSSIGAGGDRRHPLTAQPVAADGMVYALDARGEVSALSLADGRRKWQASSLAATDDSSGVVGGGLAIAGGRLYVTNGYKQLVCMDPATGKVLWRASSPAPIHSAPTVANDKVYLVTLDNWLTVFSAQDGALLWSYSGMAETTNLLGSVSPATDGTVVVLPLSSGEIIGLRVENGQVVWADNLSAVRRAGMMSAITDIRGQPVIDQNTVYAASYSGRMVAIDEVSGQRVWQREIGSAEMPWVVGDSVFVLSAEQQLISIDRQSGGIRWVAPLPRFADGDKDHPVIWTGPVLAGGRLVLAGSQGEMLEISPQDGKTLRQTSLPGDVTIAPVVADGTLLLLTRGGELVAYR